jgi:predicted DNA-binding transcriptional regulator YafY
MGAALRERIAAAHIRDAEMVDMAVVEIPDAQLELGSGYGIFAAAEVRTAELRFSAVMARWVSGERWHSQEAGRFEADGSCTLKVPCAEERELAMDILRYGSEVEVLGPPGSPPERGKHPQQHPFPLQTRNLATGSSHEPPGCVY